MICDVTASGDLEAYAFGELGPADARAVESHLFGCPACAAELRHLRAERRLFRARAEADASAVPAFEGVLARIGEEPVAARRKPAVRLDARAAGRTGSAVAALSVLAAAAASAWLWAGGAARPVPPPPAATAVFVDIQAEEICEDETTTVSPRVSDEPRASIALKPEQEPLDRAVARGPDDVGACWSGARPGEACGGGDAPMTYACDDTGPWCSVGRP